MPELEAVRRVKKSAEEELLNLPGVAGVGIGYKYVGGRRTPEVAVRVYVTHKHDVPDDQLIPPSLDGVPTDVVERDIRPASFATSSPVLLGQTDQSRYERLIGGISAGPCSAEWAGTLGMIVVDAGSGDPMMLSNFHVLVSDQGFSQGDNIAQPSVADGGSCPEDVAGLLEAGVLDNIMDAAVARIANRGYECRIAGIGVVTGTTDATLGMHVRKRGRTTGLTTGTIDAVDVTITVPYESLGSQTFTNQMEVAAGSPDIHVDPGFFIAAEWTTAPITVSGDVTVQRDASGDWGGITVIAPTGSRFHQTVSNNQSTYTVFGTPPAVLILETSTAAGPVTHRVTVVDVSTSPPSEALVLTGLASTHAVGSPVVQYSQGSGSAFLIYSSNGTEIQNLHLCRSRDGNVLCPGPGTFTPNIDPRAEATETSLIIHYSTSAPDIVCSLLPGPATPPFMISGDSGSIAVDDYGAAVGLLFASNNEVTDGSGTVISPAGVFAFANPIQSVLDALGVYLCTGGDAGGGGGFVPTPPRTRSVLRIARVCLGREPPLSLRADIFAADPRASLSLRARLLLIDCTD